MINSAGLETQHEEDKTQTEPAPDSTHANAENTHGSGQKEKRPKTARQNEAEDNDHRFLL